MDMIIGADILILKGLNCILRYIYIRDINYIEVYNLILGKPYASGKLVMLVLVESIGII